MGRRLPAAEEAWFAGDGVAVLGGPVHAADAVLAHVGACGSDVLLVPVLIGTPAYEIGLIQGVFITAVLDLVLSAFMLNGNGPFLIAGALGESSTLEKLEKAIKLGHVWNAVHNIGVSRDVDHLRPQHRRSPRAREQVVLPQRQRPVARLGDA